ncbi:hydrolase [Aureococcus anophagefferens]|nr:hydrolase [Aureococcus anophagefferens]
MANDAAPPKYQSSKETRAVLAKVEKWAADWLAAHAKGDVPSNGEVLTMLRLIGDGNWPTQARPNVTDTGKPVPGMCVGLVFALGQGAQASHVSECHPQMTRVLTRWCRGTLPRTRKGAEFPFSSLQVNYNYAAQKHWRRPVDGGPGVIDCKDAWKLFDGNKEHATPFKGERISFIAFAHGQYNKLEAPVVKMLKGMGFNAARSDGKDLEFSRFRIERSYLTDEHNDKFREELKKRNAGNAVEAALAGAGDVAVECYGRQAERGGGWMAFRGPAGVEKLELTPNSVGIWCAELTIDGTGALALADHKRVDFYNKRDKATADFSKRVKAMKPGTPVILGIADTACAASRPLGGAVYSALQLLGAPEDMPKIEYRAAWAMGQDSAVANDEQPKKKAKKA